MNKANPIIAETGRLLLRQFSSADAQGFYEMNNDPLVLQYTGDKPFASLADAAAFIASYDHYAHYGYGRWAVISRTNNTFIGFCGLKHTPATGEVDIGFRLQRQYWGKGYATEAAKAALKVGFMQYHLPMIIARAIVDNQASIAVIQKLGMRFRATFAENQQQWAIFELTRQDWLT